ncbi:MAG TPA: acyl-CoA dehydrogenase family protein [Acidimicrobiia bacterium]|nr:acyl-CoA dehydrogenase family protein [Acidimicrobiia bacterium]
MTVQLTVVEDAGLDFRWPADLLALQAEVQAVARAAGAGRPVLEDSWVTGFAPEFSLELGRRGWLGMTFPIEEGGHGRSPLERFVVTETLIAAGAPLAASWVGDRQIGPTLLANGSPAQRRTLLPGIISGRESWCIGMSEPDAGSDLASLRTRATEGDGGWIVDGAKLWTSFAAEADWCYLIARTDPDAPAHLGLSEFAVALSSPGISVRPVRDMTGAAHFCEVSFDGVRVPADHLIGQPHGSWKQLMRQLEHERGGADRLVSNRALFLAAIARADRDDPVVRQEIAALEGRYRVGRLLVVREALRQAPAGFSAATKVFCTEFEQRVAAFAGRCFGAETMLAGRVSRAVCYSPAYTIQGGTSEILRTVVAERILGLPR